MVVYVTLILGKSLLLCEEKKRQDFKNHLLPFRISPVKVLGIPTALIFHPKINHSILQPIFP